MGEMNFVAHLFLSPPNDAFRVGAILADFTIGTIDGLERQFGSDIVAGIRHHREVDRYTDTHKAVIHAVDSVRKPFGLYGGIVVDVMFDHFLLKHWSQYSSFSKELFFDSIYQSLTLLKPNFPIRYHRTIQRMLEKRWLVSYEKLENVAYALMRIGERFPRETPLSNALPEIQSHYEILENDFFRFFPELQRFSGTQVDLLFSNK